MINLFNVIGMSIGVERKRECAEVISQARRGNDGAEGDCEAVGRAEYRECEVAG